MNVQYGGCFRGWVRRSPNICTAFIERSNVDSSKLVITYQLLGL